MIKCPWCERGALENTPINYDDPKTVVYCAECSSVFRLTPAPDLMDEADEPEIPTNTCPNHGEQIITGRTATKGADPYAVDRLACGCAVVCMGPGEPNELISL
jgi:hypothetical protein